MEHPLINNIDNLTIDELQSRVNELSKKLAIAQRTGNAFLVQQVRMALETFQNKYQEKLRAQWEEKNKSGPDFSDKIDIS